MLTNFQTFSLSESGENL